MQAYCVKCRTKREIKDPEQITMKNGRPATRGVCPICGAKIFRIRKVVESEFPPIKKPGEIPPKEPPEIKPPKPLPPTIHG